MIEIEDKVNARTQDKIAMFNRMSKLGPVTVQFDARREGVDVPEHTETPPNLLLKFSPRYATYLHIDAVRLAQTLSFPGFGDAPCTVPWSAVYAMHPARVPFGKQGDSAVWPLDVPAELRRAFGISANELS